MLHELALERQAASAFLRQRLLVDLESGELLFELLTARTLLRQSLLVTLAIGQLLLEDFAARTLPRQRLLLDQADGQLVLELLAARTLPDQRLLIAASGHLLLDRLVDSATASQCRLEPLVVLMCRQLLLEAGALLGRRVALALARGQLPLEFLAAKGLLREFLSGRRAAVWRSAISMR